MIVTLQDILAMAQKNQSAIGAFNVPNFECIIAVLSAAEALNTPVILSHAELHEAVSPLSEIGSVMVMMAKSAKVPVCVHLDHCETLSYLQTALDIGFTGVMYDGSALSYEENVKNTQMAVKMASAVNVGVEGEIGTLSSREGGAEVMAGGPIYTDPSLAKQFIDATSICALAPSFGTAHGIYKEKPVLDFERLAKIQKTCGIPLVMHGGSGCSDDDYRRAIENGVRKINYYSYMSREGVQAAKNLLDTQEVTFYHDIALAATQAMKEDAMRAIRLFSGTSCN